MRNRTLHILILIALIAILNPMNTLNASDMSTPLLRDMFEQYRRNLEQTTAETLHRAVSFELG